MRLHFLLITGLYFIHLCGNSTLYAQVSVDLGKATPISNFTTDLGSVYENVSYVPLHKTPGFTLRNLRNVILTAHHIYVTDQGYSNVIFVFDNQGGFERTIGQSSGSNDEQFRLAVSEKHNKAYLLDINENIFSIIELNSGKLLSHQALAFNAIDFIFADSENRFVFFTPFNAQNEQFEDKGLVITDENLSILHLVPKGDIHVSELGLSNPLFNYKTNERLKMDETKRIVLFSNLYSGELFQLNLNGRVLRENSFYFDLSDANTVVQQLSQVSYKDMQSISFDTLYNLDNYFLDKNIAIVTSHKKNKNRIYLTDLNFNSTVSLINGVATSGTYQGDFNFYNLFPDFVSNGHCIKIYNPESYIGITHSIENKNRINHLPVINADDNPVLILFNYTPDLPAISSELSNEKINDIASVENKSLQFSVVHASAKEGKLVLSFTQAISKNQMVRILDLKGEVVGVYTLDQFAGTQNVTLSPAHLTNGYYIIQYLDDIAHTLKSERAWFQ